MRTWLIVVTAVAVLLAASTGVGFWMCTSTQANEPPVAYDLSNSINATISDDQGMGTILDSGLVRWEVGIGENGHYYQVIAGDRMWYSAQAEALAMSFHGVQGHLATITNIFEQWFINQLRLDVLENNPQSCWIGLCRAFEGGPWYWVTGEPYGDFAWWYGSEASDSYYELFAWMQNWDDNTGQWASEGNGNDAYAQGYAVEFPNPPPTADAGQDQSVTYGTLVTLDGGNSTDPDDDYPLTFSWDISSAPNGSMAAIDDPDSVTTNLTPDLLGTYVITLVVDDSYGVSSDPDQVIVNVEEPLPTLSINDINENEDVGVADFTVSLSSPSSFLVTVNYSTADGTATAGSDYIGTSDTQTFAPGEIDKIISVPIVDDFLYEGDETFFLDLLNSINATISDGQGMGTIVDNDPAGYPVELTISSTAGGNVTTPGEGTSTYDTGTVVDLVANPDVDYKFIEWTGNVSTIADVYDSTTTITMQDNYDITANFGSAVNGPTVCGGLTSISAGSTPMREIVQTLFGLFVLVSLPAALWVRRRWSNRKGCRSTQGEAIPNPKLLRDRHLNINKGVCPLGWAMGSDSRSRLG